MTEKFLLDHRNESWAVEKLLMTLREPMKAVAHKWTPGPGLSWDDLEQIGMIKAASAIQRYDASKGASMRTFVMKRAEGAMLDAVRNRTTKRQGELETGSTTREDGSFIEFEGYAPDPLDAIIAKDEFGEALDRVNELPDSFRRVLIATSLDAGIVGMPKNIQQAMTWQAKRAIEEGKKIRRCECGKQIRTTGAETCKDCKPRPVCIDCGGLKKGNYGKRCMPCYKIHHKISRRKGYCPATNTEQVSVLVSGVPYFAIQQP